jgi:hypothetical protein
MIKFGQACFFFRKIQKNCQIYTRNAYSSHPKIPNFLTKNGKILSRKTLIKKSRRQKNGRSAAARRTTTCARGDVVRSFATSSLSARSLAGAAHCEVHFVREFSSWFEDAPCGRLFCRGVLLVFLIHFYYYFLVWTETREKQLVSRGGWAAVVCGSLWNFFASSLVPRRRRKEEAGGLDSAWFRGWKLGFLVESWTCGCF